MEGLKNLPPIGDYVNAAKACCYDMRDSAADLVIPAIAAGSVLSLSYSFFVIRTDTPSVLADVSIVAICAMRAVSHLHQRARLMRDKRVRGPVGPLNTHGWVRLHRLLDTIQQNGGLSFETMRRLALVERGWLETVLR